LIGISIVMVKPPSLVAPKDLHVGEYAVFSDEYWKCVPFDVAANW
jgi:hypothetical protein